jgi:hypothetical protein
VITIAASQAIANTGAMSIFIMDGLDVDNKCIATRPLRINLPNGNKVMLTHLCNIHISGLSTVLTEHIVPSLTTTLNKLPSIYEYGQMIFCLSFPSRDRATAPGQYEQFYFNERVPYPQK